MSERRVRMRAPASAGGEYAMVPEKDVDHWRKQGAVVAPEQNMGEVISRGTRSVNPVEFVRGVRDAASDPVGTVSGMASLPVDLATQAMSDLRQGNYARAARKGFTAALPVLGGVGGAILGAPGGPPGMIAGGMAGYAGASGVAAGMDEGVDQWEQGNWATGTGALIDATVQGVLGARATTPRPTRAPAMADALDQRARNTTARTFGPTVGTNRYGWGNEARKLGPEMLRRTRSTSREGISNELEALRQRSNQALDGAYDVAPTGTRMRTAPVDAALRAEIDNLSVRTPSGSVVPMGNAEKVAALQAARLELQQMGPKLDAKSVRTLRQSWDRLADHVWEPKTNAGWEKVREVGKGYAAARDALNEATMQVYPHLRPAAADASFSIKATDLLRQLQETENARSQRIRTTAATVGGAIIGDAMGGGPAGLALGAIVAPAIDYLMVEKALPATKIRAARLMTELSDELRKNGQTARAMSLGQQLRNVAAPAASGARSNLALDARGLVQPLAADAGGAEDEQQTASAAPMSSMTPGYSGFMGSREILESIDPMLGPTRAREVKRTVDDYVRSSLASAPSRQEITPSGATINLPPRANMFGASTPFPAMASGVASKLLDDPTDLKGAVIEGMGRGAVAPYQDQDELPSVAGEFKQRGYDPGMVGSVLLNAVTDPTTFIPSGEVAQAGGAVVMGLPKLLRSAKFLNATIGNKEARRAARFLTPAEIESQMTSSARTNMQQIARARAQMPGVDELASAVVGGRDKRGWYENSRRALQQVFADDADLFAGVLAATSPQNSVESNLTNALNIYRNWNAAGRPKSRQAIVDIMGKSVSGTKGEDSVLDAWINNTVGVLEGGSVISGPKVDSFWTNLRSRARQSSMGDVRPEDAVTLDAWMANLFGIDNASFAGRTTKAGSPAQRAKFAKGDPGYSPKYLAGSSLVRETAQKLGLNPSEVQETAWSFGKALYEKAEALGISARDVVERGLLTPQDISGTVDFSLLLKDQQYAGLLGRDQAQRLSKLVRNELPRIADATEPQRKWMLKAADRLDEVRARRALNSRYRNAENAPGRVVASLPIEAATPPTNRSRVGPTGFGPGQTQKQQDNLSSALLGAGEDLAGRGVIEEAVFPGSTGSVRRGFGDYVGQQNSLRTTPVEVRVRANETIPAADERGLRFAAGAKSMFVGQDAAVVTAVHFDTKLPHDAVRVTTPNKIDRAGLDAIRRALPEGEWAVQHRSDSVDVLKLDGAITPAEATQLAGVVRQQVPMKRTTTNRGDNLDEMMPWKSGRNVVSPETAYRELPWGEVGSRDVTRWLMADYAAQSAATKRRLDGAPVRQFAGDLFEAYSKDPASRPDHLNALRIVAKKGISGLQEALDDQRELLPMLAAIGLIPAMIRAAGPPTNRQERAQ